MNLPNTFKSWWKEIWFRKAVLHQRASTLRTLRVKSWALSTHLPPPGMLKGGDICHHHPPQRRQIWKALPPEHSGYLVKVQESASMGRVKGGDRERKGCVWAKRLLLNPVLLSGPVTPCHFLPLHPHSICQIPQDVSKRF